MTGDPNKNDKFIEFLSHIRSLGFIARGYEKNPKTGLWSDSGKHPLYQAIYDWGPPDTLHHGYDITFAGLLVGTIGLIVQFIGTIPVGILESIGYRKTMQKERNLGVTRSGHYESDEFYCFGQKNVVERAAKVYNCTFYVVGRAIMYIGISIIYVPVLITLRDFALKHVEGNTLALQDIWENEERTLTGGVIVMGIFYSVGPVYTFARLLVFYFRHIEKPLIRYIENGPVDITELLSGVAKYKTDIDGYKSIDDPLDEKPRYGKLKLTVEFREMPIIFRLPPAILFAIYISYEFIWIPGHSLWGVLTGERSW